MKRILFLLATRAGTMMARDIPRWSRKEKSSFWPCMKFFIQLTKRIRSRWLDIGLALFCVFIDLDNAKKELMSNIQPCWPYTPVNNVIYRNTNGVHGFFYWLSKNLSCVVFSQTWMSSDNFLSLPTHPSLIFFPYLTFVQYYRRCIFLGASSVYFYSIISF